MEKNTDFTKIIKKIHEEKWVALSEDRTEVVDYDKSLSELNKRVDRKKVVYMKVLSSDMEYCFSL
jgi:hypothetical protein